VLSSLRQAGVDRCIVVGHPNDFRLAEILRGRDALIHQAERRGIADALRCALPLLEGEPAYLACACDSIYRVVDLRRLIACGREHPGSAAVGILAMGEKSTATRSAVQVDEDRVVAIAEKPKQSASRLVAAPLYWLPKAMQEHIEHVKPHGHELYISTALNDFIRAGGDVRGVCLAGRVEITTPQDVARAPQALKALGYAL
jgi:dTDP-glucose pyrophosphorylase